MLARSGADDKTSANINPYWRCQSESGLRTSSSGENTVKPAFDLQRQLRKLTACDSWQL